MHQTIRPTRSPRAHGKRIVGVGVAAGFLVASATTAFAAAPSESSATLSASQTGDPDGSGSIILSLDTTVGEVCSTLTTADIVAPSAAHIHRGVAGSTGPVVVPISIAAGQQCSTQDVALVNEIAASPADFYVNVHNADFPSGAIRAQVADLVDSAETSTRFTLAGSESVPASNELASTGSADLRVDTATGEVCFIVTEDSTDPLTLGHIHTGTAGNTGGVFVDLMITETNKANCVTAPTADVNTIVAAPAGHYLNLHTAGSPGGVMRGQVGTFVPLKTSTTALDGSGFGDPDGSGDVQFTIYDNGDICYTLTTSNIDAATMAHIHTGADGAQGPVLVGLDFTGTSGSQCVTTTAANAAAIVAAPADHYINVHNAAFPAGAIRAQLGLITAGDDNVEFAGIALAPTGDPDGSGTAALDIDPDTGRLCFTITTSNIADVTVAHIHSGAADATGPVVVDFDPATNGLDGCVFVEASVAAAIVAAPADFYINVHTAEAPAGAIRAQVNGDAPVVAPTTTTAPDLGGELPATGQTSAPLAWVAIAMIGAGGLIFMSTRRRGPVA